ncbi:MAG: hypothetical protein ABF608_03625 [Sporolactobacillus sp.]
MHQIYLTIGSLQFDIRADTSNLMTMFTDLFGKSVDTHSSRQSSDFVVSIHPGHTVPAIEKTDDGIEQPILFCDRDFTIWSNSAQCYADLYVFHRRALKSAFVRMLNSVLIDKGDGVIVWGHFLRTSPKSCVSIGSPIEKGTLMLACNNGHPIALPMDIPDFWQANQQSFLLENIQLVVPAIPQYTDSNKQTLALIQLLNAGLASPISNQQMGQMIDFIQMIITHTSISFCEWQTAEWIENHQSQLSGKEDSHADTLD